MLWSFSKRRSPWPWIHFKICNIVRSKVFILQPRHQRWKYFLNSVIRNENSHLHRAVNRLYFIRLWHHQFHRIKLQCLQAITTFNKTAFQRDAYRLLSVATTWCLSVTVWYQWGGVCPKVNKFGQVSSDGHQMSVVGR